MLTYITAFIFYTLAMIGVMLLGFVIYKKTITPSKGENKGAIKIIDSVSIAPKKMLLVVKVKNEKFLIASGAEHTTFLAKLDSSNQETKITNQPHDNTIMMQPEQSMIKQQENRFDDLDGLRQTKGRNLRNLFSEAAQNRNDSIEQTSARKQMIKQLIKELNEGSVK